jgi:hypothetical protein
MQRGARLQARASLPAWLPRQAHRPRYSEGPAAPRTKRAHPSRAGGLARPPALAFRLGWESAEGPRPEIESERGSQRRGAAQTRSAWLGSRSCAEELRPRLGSEAPKNRSADEMQRAV